MEQDKLTYGGAHQDFPARSFRFIRAAVQKRKHVDEVDEMPAIWKNKTIKEGDLYHGKKPKINENVFDRNK